VTYGTRTQTTLSLCVNTTALFLGLVLICSFGCRPFNQDEYIKTIKSARTAIPAALQIEKTFDEVDHTITHFGFRNESTNQWNTTAYFGGRYRLHMTVDVEIDYANNTVNPLGQPEFRLYEYSRIYDASEGRKIYGGSIGKQIEFTIEDWQKVFENHGDFTIIGVTVLRDQPLKDFEKFVAGVRSHRIPVSLAPTSEEE
jgi:hypothetical protein